jgi:hypothetical protein
VILLWGMVRFLSVVLFPLLPPGGGGEVFVGLCGGLFVVPTLHFKALELLFYAL